MGQDGGGKLTNPYPEDVFLPMNLKIASDALVKADLSPDQVFGNWGRKVWNDATEAALMEVGEWLEKRGLLTIWQCPGLKMLLQGKMPEEGAK